MATLIVGGVVLLAVAAAVWKMVRDRRREGAAAEATVRAAPDADTDIWREGLCPPSFFAPSHCLCPASVLHCA